MKKILVSLMCIALLLGATSCKDWLDVNNDPDSPNSETATAEVRLPWIQYYYMYAWGNASFRTNLTAQMFSMASNTATNSLLVNWDYAQGHSTTAYQNWFLGAACNIPDLINAADRTGAVHYRGAAKLIKAMGSIMMVDLYGEMPYTEAIDASNLSPKYDTGKDIYDACFDLVDEAIADFKSTQETTAVSLAKGDSWFGGDVNKWIQLAYAMKARWYMTLSKYDSSCIDKALEALNNAPQTPSEDLYATYTNVENASTCFTVGDAYGPNTTWDSAAWGTGQRMNRWYVNLLTNFKGSGVEDPRADKILPSCMVNVTMDAAGTITSYAWLRDAGVDAADPDGLQKQARHIAGAVNAYMTLNVGDEPVEKVYANTAILNYYNNVADFVNSVKALYGTSIEVTENADDVTIAYKKGTLYVNDTNPLYVEDLKYVQLRADAVYETAGLAVNDMNCYYTAVPANSRACGYVVGTGNFYVRPDSDNNLFTASEAAFIRAEAAFIKGDKATAYAQYKKGIEYNFQSMNRKLQEWEGKGCCTTSKGFDVTFAYSQIPQADIDAYMASAAVVQNQGSIDMSNIMMQKFIAMGPAVQNWNDMRKYDYWMNGKYGVVYTQMKVPARKLGANATFAASDTDRAFFPRRWKHSTHETNYNNANCAESYAPYGITGCTDRTIPSIPVFWDNEQ